MPQTTCSTAPVSHRPLRIALVDDDEIILAGLRSMLAGHTDAVEFVGHFEITKDLVPRANELAAELVLVDIQPGETEALEVAAGLLSGPRLFEVAIFTYDTDEDRVTEALRLGASGYLLKSLQSAELVHHLERIRDGEVAVDPTMATRIALRAARIPRARQWAGSQLGLSRRESEVLSVLATGLNNGLIAAQLGVGEETVKSHVRSIYHKLGVNDRTKAITIALRLGIGT